MTLPEVSPFGRLGFDLAHDAGGQLDRDGLAVVEGHFHGHAVFQVGDGVAHVLGLDLVLVVLGVHEHIHRVGEVGVGALLLVEDDLLHLVVGLEHKFSAGAIQQVLHLHAHGGGTTAAAAVFGLQHDHRVLALHDHVAGADFLSEFHRGCLGKRAGGCAPAPRGCRPGVARQSSLF